MASKSVTRALLACLAIAMLVGLAHSQVSTEEAERRLQARNSVRSATQPANEIEQVREENRRLRERISDLQQEIVTLKKMLAQAKPAIAGPVITTTPATSPAAPTETLAQSLIGRWRGGSNTTGSSYILQFDADNTYRQTFVFNSQKETGQYRVFDDGTMEMWSDKSPEDKKHNQYRLTTTPAQATLTPIIVDGVEVKTPRPLVLLKAD